MRSEHPELARPEKRHFLLIERLCRLFLVPGFWLATRWNRLVETVKTRKKREKIGEKMGEIRSRCAAFLTMAATLQGGVAVQRAL